MVPCRACQGSPVRARTRGKLVQEDLAKMIDWFVANGFMPKPVTVNHVVDLSFLR